MLQLYVLSKKQYNRITISAFKSFNGYWPVPLSRLMVLTVVIFFNHVEMIRMGDIIGNRSLKHLVGAALGLNDFEFDHSAILQRLQTSAGTNFSPYYTSMLVQVGCCIGSGNLTFCTSVDEVKSGNVEGLDVG